MGREIAGCPVTSNGIVKQVVNPSRGISSLVGTLGDSQPSSGGGMVTARMNGKKQLLALKLAPEAITPDDAELLEDLLVAAVNEAGRRVDEEVEQLTKGMTQGLDIPGLSGLM